MTRLILGALVVLLLAGCATQSLDTRPQTVQLVGVGTLATVGTFEYEAAPDFTRLAASRLRAASLLRNGRITAAQASEVQTVADQVRSLLDRAVAAKDRALLAKAREGQAHINKLLGG